jgi:hypothetical protein
MDETPIRNPIMEGRIVMERTNVSFVSPVKQQER